MSRNRSKTPVSVPVLYQCVALKSNYSGCSISRVVLVLEVGGVEAGGGTGFSLVLPFSGSPFQLISFSFADNVQRHHPSEHTDWWPVSTEQPVHPDRTRKQLLREDTGLLFRRCYQRKAQPVCNCRVETMLCFTEAVPGNGSMLGMTNVRKVSCWLSSLHLYTRHLSRSSLGL